MCVGLPIKGKFSALRLHTLNPGGVLGPLVTAGALLVGLDLQPWCSQLRGVVWTTATSGTQQERTMLLAAASNLRSP